MNDNALKKLSVDYLQKGMCLLIIKTRSAKLQITNFNFLAKPHLFPIKKNRPLRRFFYALTAPETQNQNSRKFTHFHAKFTSCVFCLYYLS